MQGVTFSGDVTFNGPMFDIHDNKHVHVSTRGRMPRQNYDEDEYEYVDLKFFDEDNFGTIEKQDALRRVLKRMLPKIDKDNGRDWIALYIAYHYYIDREFIMLGFADFFADIEGLLPGVLTKVNEDEEKGDKRYKVYTDLIKKERYNWFILDDCLPPKREWTSIRFNYGVDDDRRKRIQNLEKEIYKGLKEMELW